MNIAFLIAASGLLAFEAFALRIPNHKYIERIKFFLRGGESKGSVLGCLKFLCFVLLLFSPYNNWVLAAFSAMLLGVVDYAHRSNEQRVNLWLERLCSFGFTAVVFTHSLLDVL